MPEHIDDDEQTTQAMPEGRRYADPEATHAAPRRQADGDPEATHVAPRRLDDDATRATPVQHGVTRQTNDDAGESWPRTMSGEWGDDEATHAVDQNRDGRSGWAHPDSTRPASDETRPVTQQRTRQESVAPPASGSQQPGQWRRPQQARTGQSQPGGTWQQRRDAPQQQSQYGQQQAWSPQSSSQQYGQPGNEQYGQGQYGQPGNQQYGQGQYGQPGNHQQHPQSHSGQQSAHGAQTQPRWNGQQGQPAQQPQQGQWGQPGAQNDPRRQADQNGPWAQRGVQNGHQAQYAQQGQWGQAAPQPQWGSPQQNRGGNPQAHQQAHQQAPQGAAAAPSRQASGVGRLAAWAVVGTSLLTLIGCFGSWAHARIDGGMFGNYSVSVNGFGYGTTSGARGSTDVGVGHMSLGYLVAVLAIAALAAGLLRALGRAPRVIMWVAAALGGVAALIGFLELANLHSKLDGVTKTINSLPGSMGFSAGSGWGLTLVIIAALATLVAGILSAIRD